MILVLDRQHIGKPGRNDRGACYAINGKMIYEVDITHLYIMATKAEAERRGHRVVLIDSGRYGDRHKLACQVARDNPGEMVVYYACHTNAGGGNYALFAYDERSTLGKRLAAGLAHAMVAADLPGIARVRAPHANHTEWANCFHTIDGIYEGPANITGCCLEPGFPDHPDHQWMATVAGAGRLAAVLVDGAEATL